MPKTVRVGVLDGLRAVVAHWQNGIAPVMRAPIYPKEPAHRQYPNLYMIIAHFTWILVILQWKKKVSRTQLLPLWIYLIPQPHAQFTSSLNSMHNLPLPSTPCTIHLLSQPHVQFTSSLNPMHNLPPPSTSCTIYILPQTHAHSHFTSFLNPSTSCTSSYACNTKSRANNWRTH